MIKTNVNDKIRLFELATKIAIENGDPDSVFDLFDNFLYRVLIDDEEFLTQIEMYENDETTVTCDMPITEEEIEELERSNEDNLGIK